MRGRSGSDSSDPAQQKTRFSLERSPNGAFSGWFLWGGLFLMQSISFANSSANMEKSDGKARAVRSLMLRVLSPLPCQHLQGAWVILQLQRSFISLSFSHCRIMSLYLACRSHSLSEKSITHQRKKQKKHSVECLYTRRVCEKHEDKY